jgi:hypothetical protein
MSVPPTFFGKLGIVYALKLVRIGILYASLMIANNIMTQIYLEKVLVNNENPPHLRDYVILFTVIDVLFNGIFVALVILAERFDLIPKVTYLYLQDYSVSILLVVVLSLVLSQSMYNKKYFMYRDDGLRAIRALRSLIFQFGVIFTTLPLGAMVDGTILLVSSQAKITPKAPVATATAVMK